MSSFWPGANGAVLGGALAQACAFAATVPLYAGAGSLRIVRAALALSLLPILVAARPEQDAPMVWCVLQGAATGAAFGLAASAVAAAANAAAALIDGGLAWAPMGERSASGGPVLHLYQLAFSLVFLQVGFVVVISSFARASLHLSNHLFSLPAIAELARTMFAQSLNLAAPALFAQVLASLLAGVVARAAPQINGVMMSAPLVSGAVLLSLVAGCAFLGPSLAEVVREVIIATHSLRS